MNTHENTDGEAVVLHRLVSLAPIHRPFAQYIGAEGYEPNGPRAKDAQGVEYCAVFGGAWNENLVFRNPGELWQAGRQLTDDDMRQISEVNNTMRKTPENNTSNPRLVRLFRAIRPDTPRSIGCTQMGIDIAGRLRIGIMIRPTSKPSFVHFRTKPELHLRVWVLAVTYLTNPTNTNPPKP